MPHHAYVDASNLRSTWRRAACRARPEAKALLAPKPFNSSSPPSSPPKSGRGCAMPTANPSMPPSTLHATTHPEARPSLSGGRGQDHATGRSASYALVTSFGTRLLTLSCLASSRSVERLEPPDRLLGPCVSLRWSVCRGLKLERQRGAGGLGVGTTGPMWLGLVSFEAKTSLVIGDRRRVRRGNIKCASNNNSGIGWLDGRSRAQ